MRLFIFAAFVFGLSATGITQPGVDSLESEISLRTYIEAETVPLNREVVYHVELIWTGDLSRYRISEIIEPSVSNLSTRGSGSSNKVRNAAGDDLISVKEITFYFRPLEMGMAYIDGVIIRYHDTLKQKEESLISSRIGIKITDPLPEPAVNGGMFGLFGGALLLCALLIAGFFYLRYRRKKLEILARSEVELSETVEEKYLRILKETIHLTTDNIKDSLGDLTHLLNGYFGERYHIPAQTMSDKDLLGMLEEKQVSGETLKKTAEFYKKANLVKFAGESVIESDYHRLYDTVELVLTHQKSINTEEDK